MNVTEYGEMLERARGVAARVHGTLAADAKARAAALAALEPLFVEHETRFPLDVMPLAEATRTSVTFAVVAEISDVLDSAWRDTARYDGSTSATDIEVDGARHELAGRLGQLWSELVHANAELLNARFSERAARARPAVEVAGSIREYAEASGVDLDELAGSITTDPVQRRAFWDAGINPDDVARALRT